MNVTQRVVAAIQNAVRAAEADNPSLYPYLRDFGNLLDPDGQHVDNGETGEAIFGPWEVATIDQCGYIRQVERDNNDPLTVAIVRNVATDKHGPRVSRFNDAITLGLCNSDQSPLIDRAKAMCLGLNMVAAINGLILGGAFDGHGGAE